MRFSLPAGPGAPKPDQVFFRKNEKILEKIEMPTIRQFCFIMKTPNQPSISDESKVEISVLVTNFRQAASARLPVGPLNHETVTPAGSRGRMSGA